MEHPTQGSGFGRILVSCAKAQNLVVSSVVGHHKILSAKFLRPNVFEYKLGPSSHQRRSYRRTADLKNGAYITVRWHHCANLLFREGGSKVEEGILARRVESPHGTILQFLNCFPANDVPLPIRVIVYVRCVVRFLRCSGSYRSSNNMKTDSQLSIRIDSSRTRRRNEMPNMTRRDTKNVLRNGTTGTQTVQRVDHCSGCALVAL